LLLEVLVLKYDVLKEFRAMQHKKRWILDSIGSLRVGLVLIQVHRVPDLRHHADNCTTPDPSFLRFHYLALPLVAGRQSVSASLLVALSSSAAIQGQKPGLVGMFCADAGADVIEFVVIKNVSSVGWIYDSKYGCSSGCI
jgi:hypothetical protein